MCDKFSSSVGLYPSRNQVSNSAVGNKTDSSLHRQTSFTNSGLSPGRQFLHTSLNQVQKITSPGSGGNITGISNSAGGGGANLRSSTYDAAERRETRPGHDSETSSLMSWRYLHGTGMLTPIIGARATDSPLILPKVPAHISQMSSPHHQERRLEGTSSMSNVLYNFINAIIGAGIVGLPYVFMQSGLAGGIIMMAAMAYLSDYSLRLMVRAARICKVNNYEELCETCFGEMGFYTVSFAMFLFDYGAMLSMLIIMGDASEFCVERWFSVRSANVRRLVLLGLGTLLILPLCLFRDVSQLEKVSAASVATVVIIIVAVMYKFIEGKYSVAGPTEPIEWISSSLPSAMGTVAFAFVCQDCCFLIFNTLRKPTRRRWAVLVHLAIISAYVICLIFALSGYLTFRGQTKSNLLNNYAADDTLILITRVIYVFTMAFTYPISFYVTRHIIYVLVYRGPQYTSYYEKDSPMATHVVITVGLFVLTMIPVMFVTNLGPVMSITGSVAAVMLAFVLPSMCYLRLQPYSLAFWRSSGEGVVSSTFFERLNTVVPPMLLFVFGLLSGVGSTTQTVLQELGYTKI